MPHSTSLIATVVAGIGLAFVFATLAQRLRLSPLFGYLLAGVVIGPFTPGYVTGNIAAGSTGLNETVSSPLALHLRL